MTTKYLTGMNRDSRGGKLNYRCRNPLVEQSFAEYMTRVNEGKRDVSNWFKGSGDLNHDIESLLRHVTDLEAIHNGLRVFKIKENGLEHTHYTRGEMKGEEVTAEDCLNAIRFNCGLYLIDYKQYVISK